MQAELVFVHFTDWACFYLFDMHVHGVLREYGSPIPAQYKVHQCVGDRDKLSVNLTMINGGEPVDTAELEKHINRLHIFGQVQVGVYGSEELPNAA